MSDRSYSEVIVGTDGSATASRAVRAATTLASALSVPLTIVTSWYRDQADEPVQSERANWPGSSAAMESHWAEETTSDAAGYARAAGLEDVRQVQPEGAPADAMIELSEQRPKALIVVGTVGLTQRTERLLGNIPHQLTHHAQSDLLLVSSQDGDDEQDWGSVALATDGSDTAMVACRHGLSLAEAIGATPTLLTVASSEDKGRSVLDEVAAALGANGIDRQVASGGNVSKTLSSAAASYDLLVIGNKGMSGPSRLLGSVANRVTHDVPTDILLVNTAR